MASHGKECHFIFTLFDIIFLECIRISSKRCILTKQTNKGYSHDNIQKRAFVQNYWINCQFSPRVSVLVSGFSDPDSPSVSIQSYWMSASFLERLTKNLYKYIIRESQLIQIRLLIWLTSVHAIMSLKYGLDSWQTLSISATLWFFQQETHVRRGQAFFLSSHLSLISILYFRCRSTAQDKRGVRNRLPWISFNLSFLTH